MVSNFSKRSVNIVEVLNMKTCKICGCSFDEEKFEGVVVNEGIDNEYHVCCDCVPSECNNGHIISCEACGSYFSADKFCSAETLPRRTELLEKGPSSVSFGSDSSPSQQNGNSYVLSTIKEIQSFFNILRYS